ncbi:Extracellular ligand-binding receptor [Desulfamplus magnetovallimortis]|uniref:Extracellular ligand-binding receptor n=1 Tax=Desulfamplus magnetovallimortis TaxID=1246637 RepID=A0A1W1HHD9_9BACT|nr:ABC transporter substrate-binding protein [Desulfamplus magnetovallimortis]SLM31835.1 Extracellular ligand-binding receptor [Desulfamplus magnetovallimortis]
MKKQKSLLILISFIFIALLSLSPAMAQNIKIGFNIPLTGDIPKVGEESKFAGEMLLAEINGQGGLDVGGTKYKLEFIYEDNESKAESAVTAALKLIERDQVLAIVGPNSSKQAVPAGQVCNDNRTPMISPWSTNPDTTKDRPWVFRAAFLDPFQGPVAADFAIKTFKAEKAAVLYALANDYSKNLAEIFQADFNSKKGDGAVVAFESYGDKDQDFSAQLTKIISSNPDFIFLPNNYNEVALIVKQAHDLGWKGPFMGADAWGNSELMTLCGDDCKGHYFSTHYAAAGAKGATKEFIDKYNKLYGYQPADVAALTWDAINVVLAGIQNAGKITGDLRKDRKNIREGIAAIEEVKGITGNMKFDAEGDPIKCAVVVKINDAGEFEFTESVCP